MNSKWYVVFRSLDQNGVLSRFGVQCNSKKQAQGFKFKIKEKFEVENIRICCHPLMTNLTMIEL